MLGILYMLFYFYLVTSEQLSEMLQKTQSFHLRLLIGFSTGHCGTTTLSSQKSYILQPLPAVGFVFEAGAVSKDHYEKSFTIKDEISHVENVYGPMVYQAALKLMSSVQNSMHSNSSRNYTIVDLSHASIYFYRGLLHVANSNMNKLSVKFIRLRRDRIETAVSMSSDFPSFFYKDWYRYQPFENPSQVILKVTRDIWNTFSMTQKIFWAIDETEARWKHLKHIHPKLDYMELLWGGRWENSMQQAVETVAKELGIEAKPAAPKLMVHTNDQRKKNLAFLLQAVQEDKDYQRKMNYSYIQG